MGLIAERMLLYGCAGVTLALVGRSFVPRRGSVLFIEVVTAMLKMFSLGGIVLKPDDRYPCGERNGGDRADARFRWIYSSHLQ